MPLPTISGVNAAGQTVEINTLPQSGQATKANSLPMTLASDQDALLVVPQLTSAGHVAVDTPSAGGTNFAAFASQAAKQLTLVNASGTQVEVRQGSGTIALPLPDGTLYTFYGISNINQLSVRRSDGSTVSVNLVARWEA